MMKRWFALSALSAGVALVGLACVEVEEEESDLAVTDDELAAGSEDLAEAMDEDGEDAAALCGGVKCDPGEECIGYLGIAGARGPRFYSCGIRCQPGRENAGCPEGTRCVSIADGPGPLCL